MFLKEVFYYFKGYYRKGTALIQLNKYNEAKLCFETALSIDSSNKESSNLLNACLNSIELTVK